MGRMPSLASSRIKVRQRGANWRGEKWVRLRQISPGRFHFVDSYKIRSLALSRREKNPRLLDEKMSEAGAGGMTAKQQKLFELRMRMVGLRIFLPFVPLLPSVSPEHSSPCGPWCGFGGFSCNVWLALGVLACSEMHSVTAHACPPFLGRCQLCGCTSSDQGEGAAWLLFSAERGEKDEPRRGGGREEAGRRPGGGGQAPKGDGGGEEGKAQSCRRRCTYQAPPTFWFDAFFVGGVGGGGGCA
jgi:hypothetical protein